VPSILIIITSNVITVYVPYPNLTNSGFINVLAPDAPGDKADFFFYAPHRNV